MEREASSIRAIEATLEKIPGGRYEIENRLGTGAFGSVYKALDTFLNRPVAVKSIRLDTTLDPEHRKALNKRFIREAQVAAQLHHPNIVTIHDIIFTPETGFIVMEFIEGRTLESLLKEQRLPPERVIDIGAQVASALRYAHEHKIIHRDIKPANIMITPGFEARITDFGIAKSDGGTQLTMSGSLVGTPDYMSPEQAKGEDVDVRSDIFSLGCVLYECTAGEKPFTGSSLTAVLLSIVNTDPLQSKAWKSVEAPKELEAALTRTLAKDPGKRFSTAADLVEALKSIPLPNRSRTGAPIAAPPQPDDAPAGRAEAKASPAEVDAAALRREEQLRSLKDEDRPLKFATKLSDELQDISLTPAEGFILSRIDGASLARDIIALSPMPEAQVAKTLAELIEKGLLDWSDGPSDSTGASGDSPTRRRGGRPKYACLDAALEKQVERILAFAPKKRYHAVLGVNQETPTADVKKAYLELIQRFHPDAHPKNLDPAVQRKLSRVCALATEALTALSAKKRIEPKAPVPPVAQPAASSSTRPPSEAAAAENEVKRKRYALDLFRRAQRAYDTANYWEAIQLARQAVELDDQRAEFHHLLGIGLMKNRNWLKEAEECLRKAADLDPTKAEYFGVLATVYKAVGLPERSATMLERAKELDPSYC